MTVEYAQEFAEHHRALVRYAYRLTGDRDRAEDVAQEAFARLLEHAVPEDKVRSWLFRVALNVVRDEARTRGRRTRLLEESAVGPAPPETPDAALERRERVAAVRRALDRLAERDRTMLLMRERGYAYAEIAEEVDVAASSVGTLLARALRRFEDAYRDASHVRLPDGSPDAEGDGR
ncbi:MAG TPA: sigma-70 family RNA polymerase sigma factor [Gemmatimonadota bacterium]|nr:sigma-70 family RNA polymerase sigma factor [Gemmatimonadota bacterium]